MAEWWRPYGVLIGSRLRSQTAYRRSFALDLVGAVGIGLVEFVEIYVVFTNVDVLGELDFAAALLVFALANISFSLADTLVGHVDNLPTYLREGTLDAFMLRPLPVLAQLVSSDVSLRRLGRTLLAVVILAIAVPMNDIAWSPSTVLLFAIVPVAGTAIFAALFVCAGAAQFWLVEGGEFTSAFTYGAGYASQYPASIFTVPMRVLFTFVVPASFVAYLPALVLLDLPAPGGLPSWIGWLSPVAAVAIWGVALAGWRAGLRHYTGAGS
ncbi:MAG TPA: ABC-2 family transporter protein [Jiangellaceae bacterium]